MFRFKGNDVDKQVNVHLFKDKLDALKNKISEIQVLETGINISESPAAFDLLLYTEFRSTEDLEIYKSHPDHQAILPDLKKLTQAIHVVDYEI